MQKNSVKWILGLVAVGIIVFFSAALRGQREGISRLPVRLTSVKDWSFEYGQLWLTDHELFHFTGDGMHGYQPMVYDTQTHSDSAEPHLSALQTGHVISVSPDGKWVMWDTGKYETSVQAIAVTQRSSGKTFRWPKAVNLDGSCGYWLPGSRRWLGITYAPTGKFIHGHPVEEKRFVIFSVDHPGYQSLPLPGDGSLPEVLGVNRQGHIIINHSLLYAGGTADSTAPPLSLTEVSLDPKHSLVRNFQVPLPNSPPGDAYKIQLSPNGEELSWTCYSNRPATILGWFSLWTKRSYAGGTGSLDIWVLPLDGRPARHIGTYSGQSVGFDAHWNPDSQHLDFTLKDDLYSVFVG